MDLEKAGLVICLTIFIVVGVNAAIYASVKRGGTVGQIELLRRAASRARHPWKNEDEDLKELSARVAKLKQPPEDVGGQK